MRGHLTLRQGLIVIADLHNDISSVGKISKAGDVTVYIATPTVDYPKDKALLFLSDVFGLELVNNKVPWLSPSRFSMT